MDFQIAVRIRAFQRDAKFLPQYFKTEQFARPLTRQEQDYGRGTAFKVKASGQEVYIYAGTHIPASNPVERIRV